MLLQLHHCLYTGAEEPRRGGGWEFGSQLELGIYIGFLSTSLLDASRNYYFTASTMVTPLQ